MDSINRRISELIGKLNTTKTDFADKLNVSQAFVSQICSGARNPSERTIGDICRIYRVSEEWLRTGNGEMLLPAGDDDEMAEIFAEIKVSDDQLIRGIIRAYWKMDEQAKAQFRQLVCDLADGIKKEKAPGKPETL